MERHFDEELRELNRELLKMGTLAQESIAESVDALANRDKAKALAIIHNDDRIDEMELVIDDKCIDLIARHQPMARDLRLIAAAMKMNADLERIADLSLDIAQRVLEIADQPMLKPLTDITRLAEVARRMVRDAIASFVDRDVNLARSVLLSDPEADDLRNRVQEDLINDYMLKDPTTVPRAVRLLLVARHLERICDHATNIAEDVIYLVQGKVVKHHPEKLQSI